MAFDLTNGAMKYHVERGYGVIGGFFSTGCLLYSDENSNIYKYDPESEKDVCEYKGKITFRPGGEVLLLSTDGGAPLRFEKLTLCGTNFFE